METIKGNRLKKSLMMIDTSNLTYKQWQAARRDYIGGSDVATTMDLNPYQSKLELFHQKVGVIDSISDETEATYSGNVLEDVVKEKWWQYYDDDDPTIDGIIRNAEKGNKTRFWMSPKSIIYDPRFPHLKANVDGLILPSKGSRKPTGILEVKTGLDYVWKQYESEIPVFYVIQAQTYMLITGLKYCEIAVLLDGRYFKCFPMEASAELHSAIIEGAQEFWNLIQEGRIIWESAMSEQERLMRLANIEPEPDGGKSVDQYLKERYRSNYKEQKAEITDEIIQWGKDYKEHAELVKEAEIPKTLAAQRIREAFINYGVNEFTSDGKVVMSYRRSDENTAPKLIINKKVLTL